MAHICLSGMTRPAMVFGIPLRFFLCSILVVGFFYGICLMLHQVLLCTLLAVAWGIFLWVIKRALAKDPHYLRLFLVKWLRDKGNGTTKTIAYQRLTATEALSQC